MSARARTNGEVALMAYPGCSLLELIGAQCVWATASRFSTLRTVVVGPTRDFIPSSTPLSFRPQKTFAEVPNPEVLIVIGGGDATGPASDDPELLAYVRDAAAGATVVASTGTGSLVLAAAGLLHGREATTHWAYRKQLEAMDVAYRRAGVVEDGSVVTGAGASAAIDMSLALLARLRSRTLAKRVQIMVEWDPAPPFGPIDWSTADAASPVAPAGLEAAAREVALVIYEGLTVLDLVGPLEVVSALARVRPEIVPVVVAEQAAPVTSDNGLTFMPNRAFEELPAPDALILPGGSLPTVRAMSNPLLRAYVRNASAAASKTASVCTGALLLASVGLLDGRDATTHWAYRQYLPAFGARYVQRRWVESDGIINSAGVSAGIDMALRLAAELTDEATAQQVQLALHYDPDPPFGGIDYDRLPALLRAVRGVVGLTVPAFVRRPRRLLRQGK
jgi:transcriptional regulator GlxA family with amidase domain